MFNPFVYGPGQLDPANLWESGGLFSVGSSTNTDKVFTAFATGAPLGYFRVGSHARYRWTTDATAMRVGYFGSSVANVRTYVFGVRANVGTNVLWEMPSPNPQAGVNYVTIALPPGLAKIVDLIVPMQNATAVGAAPQGAYPFEVFFNSPATTVVPSATTFHLGVYGDSIASGGNAYGQPLFGFPGLLKRGLAIQSGAHWKGAWSSVTAYSIGDCVSSGKWAWKAKTANTNVTPVSGADWQLIGFNGKVTMLSYGFRRCNDDFVSTGTANAFSAAVAALGLTDLVMNIGSNDQAVAGAIAVATHQTQFARALDAFRAAQAGLRIHVTTPYRRGNPEAANGLGETMAQFRTAQTTEVTNRAGWALPPTVQDGLAVLGVADLDSDLTHPRQPGSVLMMAALAAAIP